MHKSVKHFIKKNVGLYIVAELIKNTIVSDEADLNLRYLKNNEKYYADYRKWQWLRNIILRQDELRLRKLVIDNCGFVVSNGPFVGLSFESCANDFSAAMMLGFYEVELNAYIEAALDHNYQNIVNIGCSFGYYAVGFARRLPSVNVFAYDIDVTAQKKCKELAWENKVSDRVFVRGAFEGQDFGQFINGGTLIVCDIEGAEKDLLDPTKYSALASFDIIAELHDVYDNKISSTILSRFEKTHKIIFVEEGMHPPISLPQFLKGLGSIERFIACHGGLRWGPTPWAVMRAKHTGGL